MSELRNRMIQDMQLAGLVEGTRREYLRALRQRAAYYMVPPDRLTERQVQDYLLYVRDELGVAKGTFAPVVAGLKSFDLNTLGHDWPLLTNKKSASRGKSGCPTSAAMPDVRSDEDCRRLNATLQKPVDRGCFTLIYACGLQITEAVTLRVIGARDKERVLPLTESIVDMLREEWKTPRSKRWLFPSRRVVTHLPDATRS